MPELPEVEASRRAVVEYCQGKTISEAVAAVDNIVIEGISPSDLADALTGRVLVAANRKGKHLWFELDKRPWLTFHFGMTGSIKIHGVKLIRYQRSVFKHDEEWPPKFYKLVLKFHDGTQLAFTDARRFARIRLLDDPLAVPPISELGLDAFSELPAATEFAEMVSKKNVPIKAALLDQHFLAGVGNWVADEVLYQACIHPEQTGTSLIREQCDSLHRSLEMVLKTAVELDADSENFPKNWLFHYRWDKRAGKVDGHPISFARVGSRTTAFVPALQKKVHSKEVRTEKGGSKPEKLKLAKDVQIIADDELVAPPKLVSTRSRKRSLKSLKQQEDNTTKTDDGSEVRKRGKGTTTRGPEETVGRKTKDVNEVTNAGANLSGQVKMVLRRGSRHSKQENEALPEVEQKTDGKAKVVLRRGNKDSKEEKEAPAEVDPKMDDKNDKGRRGRGSTKHGGLDGGGDNDGGGDTGRGAKKMNEQLVLKKDERTDTALLDQARQGNAAKRICNNSDKSEKTDDNNGGKSAIKIASVSPSRSQGKNHPRAAQKHASADDEIVLPRDEIKETTTGSSLRKQRHAGAAKDLGSEMKNRDNTVAEDNRTQTRSQGKGKVNWQQHQKPSDVSNCEGQRRSVRIGMKKMQSTHP